MEAENHIEISWLEDTLQNRLKLLLLLGCQASGELDFDADNEVTAFSRLLALRHTEVRVTFCPRRTCGPATANAQLFAVNCLNCPSPASEGFFEVEFNRALDVVALTGKEGMRFLRMMLVVCSSDRDGRWAYL
jgi:hypothetical protein